MQSATTRQGSDNCRKCGQARSDLRLLGCGCTLHVRCAPLSLVVAEPSFDETYNAIPKAASSNTRMCPICGRGPFHGIYLYPLSFSELDEAREFRKQCIIKAAAAADIGSGPPKTEDRRLSGTVRKCSSHSETTHGGLSSPEEEAAHMLHAESSLLLLTQTPNMSSETDRHNHRTGRFTKEEMAYTDHLIRAFDEGTLLIPHGVKLNEFLGDLLLCKSSRLSKKMKNAKLSTKSYVFRTLSPSFNSGFCCGMLSKLQEAFLISVPSELTKLELSFATTKQWRTHFSNMCLQIGYDSLDTQDWSASLEEMERRACEAREQMQKARRRKMGLALQKDTGPEVHHGVRIGGAVARDAVKSEPTIPSKSTFGSALPVGASVSLQNVRVESQASLNPITISSSSVKENTILGKRKETETDECLSKLLESTSDTAGTTRPRLFSDDLSVRSNHAYDDSFSECVAFGLDPLQIINQMSSGRDSLDAPSISSNNGSFLDRIIRYMESMKVPFEHVEIWVPSILPKKYKDTNVGGVDTASSSDTGSNVQCGKDKSLPANVHLIHAGCATRADLSTPFISHQLNEFGTYSTNFSFALGAGLPGRVCAAGAAIWEDNVQHLSTAQFARCGGAKVFGVKSAVGIPVKSPTVGTIVVVMFSSSEVRKDLELMKKLESDLSRWMPEPAWDLFIEAGPSSVNESEIARPVAKKLSTMPKAIAGGGPHADTTAKMAVHTFLHPPSQPSISNNGVTSTEKRVQCSTGNAGGGIPPPPIFRRDSSSGAPTKVAAGVALNQKDRFHTQGPHTYEQLGVSNSFPSARTGSSESTSPQKQGKAKPRISNHIADDSTLDSSEAEEHRIITLLGEHMPLNVGLDQINAGNSPVACSAASTSSSISGLLPYYMALRLLLLKPPSRRSPEETDMLDIVKKSFRGYAKDNNRSGSELATLVVKDWMYLSSASEGHNLLAPNKVLPSEQALPRTPEQQRIKMNVQSSLALSQNTSSNENGCLDENTSSKLQVPGLQHIVSLPSPSFRSGGLDTAVEVKREQVVYPERDQAGPAQSSTPSPSQCYETIRGANVVPESC